MGTLKLIQHDDNVHEIELRTNSKSEEVSLLVMSDTHLDSTKCDRKRFVRDLKEAQSRGAIPCIIGDVFDFMQGRYDPRSNKAAIRPEYKGDNYIDLVIEDIADLIAKYCTHIIITKGNHETNILKRLETDVTERLATALRSRGVEVLTGQYSGWIMVSIVRQDGGAKATSWISYHHGFGGNAKRSKGVLAVDLNQKNYPDADVVVQGHIHQKWYVPMTIRRVNNLSRKTQRLRTIHLQCGSYKMLNEKIGWEAEKGFDEPPLGGWFLTFRRPTKNTSSKMRVMVEDTEQELEVIQ